MLAFSLLMEPVKFDLPASRWPTLSLAVGGAIATVIDRLLPLCDVRLKWPNDVYFDGRKGCGILNESVKGDSGRLVIGVGINVNNSLTDAPDEVRSQGASLIDLKGAPIDRGDLLVALIQQLETDITLLAKHDPTLPDRWRRLCLLTGAIVTVELSGERLTGSCLGLDDDGALRIQTITGPQRIFSGTVVDF